MFVLDDSVTPRERSKKTELLSHVYDHVRGKTIKGFNLLALGWTDAFSFVPVGFRMLASAKAWAKAHQDDFQDVPTHIISFDTIHGPKQLAVNTRDLNSTVRSDPELCDLFLKASAKAGVPCKKGIVPLFGGSTDSAAFTQGGFCSIGITGLNHVLEDYYVKRLFDS